MTTSQLRHARHVSALGFLGLSASCGAVDRCLDQGGRWNADTHVCEFAEATVNHDADLPSIAGSWVVAGFHQPGVTALTAQEAASWVGKFAEFSDSKAAVAEFDCQAPTYEEAPVPQAVFRRNFRLDPAVLDLPDPVIETTVTCENTSTWPGGTVLQRDDHLLVLWDGTFLVLQRQDSGNASEQ